MTKYSFVVARYKEDVFWLDEISKKFKNDSKFFIYNKGGLSYKKDQYINIDLPNTGRESHTYLTHIIENYHDLSENIIFTQGSYHDHVINLDVIISKSVYFYEVSYFPDFRIGAWRGSLVKNKDNFSLDQWIKKYIEKDFDYFISKQGYYVRYGAIFNIEKEAILSRPIEFYINLRKQLTELNPEVGHFFERSWYYIFNLHKKEIIFNPDFIIAGSGLSGSVIAERLSSLLPKSKILIVEKRDHVGGNCYDYVDEKTGIRVGKYGAHIFHTNNDEVWSYVNKFSKWESYHHRVYGKTQGKIFPVPINVSTINILCNKNIKTKEEMIEYLDSVRDKTITDPKNSEEYCLGKFGRELYEKIIREYTKKQWDKYPNELDVSVLQRLFIRYDDSEGYFRDKYQALPVDGYTKFISNMISRSNICVLYNTDFNVYKTKQGAHSLSPVFYTGPIDSYYADLGLPKLDYRSIDFKFEILNNTKYYQENSVINYTTSEEKFTRIVEYKYFLNQKSDHTIFSKEYTTDVGEPYYPVPNQKNRELYEKYKEKTLSNTKTIFLGRLASYKYFNMDEAIANSLAVFKDYSERYLKKTIDLDLY